MLLSVHSFLLPRLRCLNRSKSCIYFRCKRNQLASLKYPRRTTTVYGEYLFPQPLHPTSIRSVVRQTSVRFYYIILFTQLSQFLMQQVKQRVDGLHIPTLLGSGLTCAWCLCKNSRTSPDAIPNWYPTDGSTRLRMIVRMLKSLVSSNH